MADETLPPGTYEAADEAFEEFLVSEEKFPRDELEAALIAAARLIRTDERKRLLAALAARKVTLGRPGFGFKADDSVDMVPWTALAVVFAAEAGQ